MGLRGIFGAGEMGGEIRRGAEKIFGRSAGEGAVLRTAQRRMPLPRPPRGEAGGLAPVPHPNRREGKGADEGGGACRTGRNSAGKSDKSVNFVASVRFLCYIGIVKKEINRRRVLLWIRNC